METYNKKFKPGDRALVVSSGHKNRNGKCVTILGYRGHDLWVEYDEPVVRHNRSPFNSKPGCAVCGKDFCYELINNINGKVESNITNKLFIINDTVVKHTGFDVKKNQLVTVKGYYKDKYFVAVEII